MTNRKEKAMEITTKTARGMEVSLEPLTERVGVRVSFEMGDKQIKALGCDYGKSGIVVRIDGKRCEVSVPREDFDKVREVSRAAVRDHYQIVKSEDGLLWIVSHGGAYKLVELGLARGTRYITVANETVEALGTEFTIDEARAYAEAKQAAKPKAKPAGSHLEYRQDGEQGEYPCEVASNGTFIRWME